MTKAKKVGTRLSFSESLTVGASIFLALMILKSPTLTGGAVRDALHYCASLLIPSLFPLMVASELALECGAAELISRPLQRSVGKLLGMDNESLSPYFLSLLGGFTASVRGAIRLYNDGRLTKTDCERLIALSNIPSLAFIVGFVGNNILHSTAAGWCLWGICVISTLIIGALTKGKQKSIASNAHYDSTPMNGKTKESFSKMLVDSISRSATSMIMICACVVFFSTLIECLREHLGYIPIGETTKTVILGSLEMTRGILLCKDISSPFFKTVLVAFFVGWSGLCVHTQVIALCDRTDLSFKKYFIIKLLQGFLCALLSTAIFSIIK